MKTNSPRISQKEVTRRLVLFQYLEIQSARLLGGWLPGIRRWEHKHAAAHHLWQDAQRSKALRTRLWELKISRPERQLPDSVSGLPEALAHAQRDDEFLAGFYLGLKSDLLDAYRALVEATHPVNDAPTVETVERLMPELESQIEWARAAFDENPPSGEDRRRLDRFLGFVRSQTAAVLAGPAEKREEPLPPPPGYGNSPLPFSEAKRDERFELHFTGIPRPNPDDVEGNRLFQFVNYAHEMQAAETLGSVLWEVGDMPWEFYYDVARHCYDEARHCQLGEARLAELMKQAGYEGDTKELAEECRQILKEHSVNPVQKSYADK